MNSSAMAKEIRTVQTLTKFDYDLCKYGVFKSYRKLGCLIPVLLSSLMFAVSPVTVSVRTGLGIDYRSGV